MKNWQVQEAKNKFSEVIRDAQSGEPQFITKHGERTAVLLSAEEYDRLVGTTEPKKDLISLLLGGPKVDHFEVPRSSLTPRDVEF